MLRIPEPVEGLSFPLAIVKEVQPFDKLGEAVFVLEHWSVKRERCPLHPPFSPNRQQLAP
jgi:hypothetical protein